MLKDKCTSLLLIVVLFLGEWFLLPPQYVSAAATVIFFTSGTSWTIPADWNNISNTIEVIGGGGSGNDYGSGGGGAYAKCVNLTLTSGNIVSYSVGSPSMSSWFNASSLADAVTKGNLISCAADYGRVATASINTPGGQAANSVGGIVYSGGSGVGGGNLNAGSGGGGGAGGPFGNGGSGGTHGGQYTGGGGGGGGGGVNGENASTTANYYGGKGGNNYLGIGGGGGGSPTSMGLMGLNGGGGGGAGNRSGAAGGSGTEWDATHGSGGGGGGNTPYSGGNPVGGLYGGGAAGPGIRVGGQGIIVITYTPVVTMLSTNYAMQADSINFAGNRSSSASYIMNDTLGEVATGDSASANYVMRAGYQQMPQSYISISATGNPDLPSMGGISAGTGNASTTWTVTTDNPAGYSLSINATGTPAMQGQYGDNIADYVSAGVTADYNFTILPNQSLFGFNPLSVDIISRYKNDGVSACNTGSNNTIYKCWDGLSTTTRIISQGTVANQPLGATTTVVYQVQIGSSKIQTSGNYAATITVTAVTL